MRVASLCAFVALFALASASLAVEQPASNSAPYSARLRVTGNGWPACDPGVVQRSGYIDINSTEQKHYFYWMFEAKQNPSTAPVILWMTGGPGCSSSLAILAENGPCHMNETSGNLYSNPYSWNNVANVIYIDQPAGVGFSYTESSNGYDFNETMVANDMYTFLTMFFTQFPQYAANDFFIYGESYGGHFAPATAHRVYEGNKAGGKPHINLKGLSVGNGLVDPAVQFSWYSKLSYQWCQNVLGAPCVSQSTYEGMLSGLPGCLALIDSCNNNQGGCGFAMEACQMSQMSPFQQTGLNVYDIRIPCDGQLCYNFDASTAFMNQANVQQSLGVAAENITWQACAMGVNQMFQRDFMRDFNQTIPALLENGIRVLVYNGDVDFICNWLGSKAWALGLQWSGAAGFKSTPDLPWWLNQEPAGRFRMVSGKGNNMLFTFLQVHDAGHMVPMNQPHRALEMVKHFLNDTAFFGFEGPVPKA